MLYEIHVQGFHLLYTVVLSPKPLQINQPKMTVTSKVNQCQYSCKHNGWTTEGNYRPLFCRDTQKR
jgi:hypothetical protein